MSAVCDARLSDDCAESTDDVVRDSWTPKYINKRLVWAICPECMPLITSLTEFNRRLQRSGW
jgi:hypothetical protein